MLGLRSCSARGFTVIELLLVIAATAIVAAVLLSAYRTHVVRREVAAGVEAAAGLERIVEKAFRDSGQMPADWSELGTGPADHLEGYVESIDLVYGRLDITYGNRAHPVIVGRRVSLTPYETVSQDVVWICGNAIPGLGLKPLGFAAGGAQSVQVPATIEARYLPSSCR
jgi:type IV pilus assembly protein PilA